MPAFDVELHLSDEAKRRGVGGGGLASMVERFSGALRSTAEADDHRPS